MKEIEVDLLCEIVISKLPPHVQKKLPRASLTADENEREPYSSDQFSSAFADSSVLIVFELSPTLFNSWLSPHLFRKRLFCC